MFEAVICYRDTLEPFHTVLKGTLEECKNALIKLIEANEWDFEDLSIINLESGRHISYILEY